MSEPTNNHTWAAAARCNHIGIDRPDIPSAARTMSSPAPHDNRRIERMTMSKGGVARKMVQVFDWKSSDCDTLTVNTDADSAECRSARRSIGGGAVLWGTHHLRSWSSTHRIMALSSDSPDRVGSLREGPWVKVSRCESIHG